MVSVVVDLSGDA